MVGKTPEAFNIPNGLEHFVLIAKSAQIARASTNAEENNHRDDLLMIGTCLSALYQAATCHRKCHGGAHVLEALCGRSYNISIAAYHLSVLGFYDEALNLVRGLGEIANLVMLSVIDKDAIGAWLSADRKTRIKQFAPGKIRKLLRKSGTVPMLSDDDWYSDLCEKYVHVTPQTRPNMHTGSQAIAGGVYQPQGQKKALGELATIIGGLTLLICKYFQFDDLYTEILAIVAGAKDSKPTTSLPTKLQ